MSAAQDEKKRSAARRHGRCAVECLTGCLRVRGEAGRRARLAAGDGLQLVSHSVGERVNLKKA